MEKKFSFIIPVYNCERLIGECIESILSVDYTNWELIIVNDGSTDHTESVCREYSAWDSRIRLYSLEENRGVSNARNIGLSKASGEYVLFVDADDRVDKNICTVFHLAMEDCDYCISGYTAFDRHHSRRYISDFIGRYEWNDIREHFSQLFLNGDLNTPWGKCYRRDRIDFSFDTNVSNGEDQLFNLKYLGNCRRISIISDNTYFHRKRVKGSLTNIFYDDSISTYLYFSDKKRELISDLSLLDDRIEKAIDEALVLNMILLLHQKAEAGNDEFFLFLKKLYADETLEPIIKQVSLLNHGLRWEIERILLRYQLSGLLLLCAKSIVTAKKILIGREFFEK